MRRSAARFAAFIVLVVFAPCSAGPAAAYDRPIERALAKLVQTAAPAKDQTIGIGNFRDKASLAGCEPLNTIYRDAVAKAIDRSGSKLRRQDYQYAGDVNYIVWGEWLRTQRMSMTLELRLVAPNADSMGGQAVGSETVRIDIDELPQAAARCLVTTAPMEQRVRLQTRMAILDSPDANGRTVAELQTGEEMLITGAVREVDWFVVRLADDGRMPTGMRERRGFIRRAALADGSLRDSRLGGLEGPFTISVATDAGIRLSPAEAERIQSAVQASLAKAGIRTTFEARGAQGAIILALAPVAVALSGDLTNAVVKLTAKAVRGDGGSVFALAEATGRAIGSGEAPTLAAAAAKAGAEVGPVLVEKMLAGAGK